MGEKEQKEYCYEHKCYDTRLTYTEESIKSLWKAVNDVRNWVIAGMSGLLIQVLVVVAKILLE